MIRRFLFFMLCFCVYQTWLCAQGFILTNDQQLRDLANNPSKEIDNTTGFTKSTLSLQRAVESASKKQDGYITIAFDEFFRQYRDDTNNERLLTPDMDEYVNLMGQISDYAMRRNVGLELSLLSPLELGQAYRNQTGHTGQWMAYKVGRRNPHSGKFSLQMWQQLVWTNNKGMTPVVLKDVRAYAFKGKTVAHRMVAVAPDDIRPLNDVHWEVIDSMGSDNGVIPQQRLRIYGEEAGLEDYDQVLVLLELSSQEMDYFADDALPFLQGLLKKYHERGIALRSLYCDEMHIQQDWAYFSHHETGQFALRYFTPSLARYFTKQTGMPFDERYLLYFVSQPPVELPTVEAVLNVEYVLGATPQDVHRTYLMRDHYYRMLNNHVVDLFKNAKQYAETLFGRHFETSAHASWAESPTIDYWEKPRFTYAVNYEYTPNFLWSNTVHQAASACYDYFKWGEYLVPTGNDYCECGWLDRNYYGAAMAASIAVINDARNAYAAAWGMPAASYERRMAINYSFGCQPPDYYRLLTDGVIRDEDVLMLYPMNLVAVDPRFGSWTTQYAYANYLTGDKLIQLGRVIENGKLQVLEKVYGTLVICFEPLPDAGLLDMIEEFVNRGGCVVWLSAPPLLDKTGKECLSQWQRIFGVHYSPTLLMGEPASGHRITFCGTWERVPTQDILTDFVVDHLFPVSPENGTEKVATSDAMTVGTMRQYQQGGRAFFGGFRPRDDQSQSLGYESRTMFELLLASGAYPSTGYFTKENDNPAYVSRTTEHFVTRFPNGSTFVTNHYRAHVETWDGNFSRNPERDAQVLQNNPLPTDTLRINDEAINGHRVKYKGRLTMAFRSDGKRLLAFMGQRCKGITLDGQYYEFCRDTLQSLTFGPVKDDASHLQLYVDGQPEVTIPVGKGYTSATATQGKISIPTKLRKGQLTLSLQSGQYGKVVDIQLK